MHSEPVVRPRFWNGIKAMAIRRKCLLQDNRQSAKVADRIAYCLLIGRRESHDNRRQQYSDSGNHPHKRRAASLLSSRFCEKTAWKVVHLKHPNFAILLFRAGLGSSVPDVNSRDRTNG